VWPACNPAWLQEGDGDEGEEGEVRRPAVGDADFTSEDYKVRLRNVPQFLRATNFRKLLASLKLVRTLNTGVLFVSLSPLSHTKHLPTNRQPDAVKVKKGDGWNYAFLTFGNEQDRVRAIAGLDGHVIKFVLPASYSCKNSINRFCLWHAASTRSRQVHAPPSSTKCASRSAATNPAPSAPGSQPCSYIWKKIKKNLLLLPRLND
jgi:hypothetical protein